MKKIITALAVLLLMVLAFTACQKNSLKPTIVKGIGKQNINSKSVIKNNLPVNIKNNIIIFNNWKQYNKFIEQLSKYNSTQVDRWASLNNFESYNKRFKIAMTDLENANSLMTLKALMKKYSDILTVRVKKDGIHYGPVIYPNPYTNVANKDGLYVIGEKAYRILGEYKLSTNRNEIDKLLTIHYSDIKNNRISPDVEIRKYAYLFSTASNFKNKTIIIDTSSGNNSSNSYVHHLDARNQTSNRRVNLHVVAYWNPYPSVNAVSYYAYIQASAEKKKWWAFNSWLPYKTEIDIEGTKLNGDDFIVITPWGIESYDIPHMVSAEDCSSLRLPSPYYGFGPKTWDAYPGPEMYIMQVHLKAWTRGTTQNVFANIEYN